MVWCDQGLNPGLPDYWQTLYSRGQWASIILRWEQKASLILFYIMIIYGKKYVKFSSITNVTRVKSLTCRKIQMELVGANLILTGSQGKAINKVKMSKVKIEMDSADVQLVESNLKCPTGHRNWSEFRWDLYFYLYFFQELMTPTKRNVSSNISESSSSVYRWKCT